MKLNFRPPDATSAATAVVAPNAIPRTGIADQTARQASQLGTDGGNSAEGVLRNEIIWDIEGGGEEEVLVRHDGGSGKITGTEKDNVDGGSSNEIRGTDGNNIVLDQGSGLQPNYATCPVTNSGISLPLAATTGSILPNATILRSDEHTSMLNSSANSRRYSTSARTVLVYVLIALAVLTAPFFVPIMTRHSVRIAKGAFPFEVRLKESARDALSSIWAGAIAIVSQSHRNNEPWGPTIIWEGPFHRTVESKHIPGPSNVTSISNRMTDRAQPVSVTTIEKQKAVMEETAVAKEQDIMHRVPMERPHIVISKTKEHHDVLLGDSVMNPPKSPFDKQLPSDGTKDRLRPNFTGKNYDFLRDQSSQVTPPQAPRVSTTLNNQIRETNGNRDLVTSSRRQQRDVNNIALVDHLLDGDIVGWQPYAVVRNGRLWIGPTMEGRLSAEIGRRFSNSAVPLTELCDGAQDVHVDFSHSARVPGSIEVTAHCGSGTSCNTRASVDDIRLLTVSTDSSGQGIPSSRLSLSGYFLETGLPVEMPAKERSNNVPQMRMENAKQRRVWGPIMGPLRVAISDDAMLTITAYCPELERRTFKIVPAAQLKMGLARLDTMNGVKDGGVSWRSAFRYDAHPQRHIGKAE